MNYVLGILLALSSLFLILLVLIQQGRGGGLAGAFGGMGGQSAFGTKAGDLFTKITIGVAAVWILLCVATVKYATIQTSPFGGNLGSNAAQTVNPGGGTGESSTEKTPPASPPAQDEGTSGTGTPAEKSEGTK
jgi:preprotein translocase subunit SecG